MMTMKRLWLVAVLTLCVGATASAYDLTVALSEHGSVGFSVGGTAVTTAGAGEVVTVTVTPATGYAQKEVTARAYTSWEAARARRRAPDLMDDITVTKQQDGTWQFTMPEANVQVKVSYVQIVDYDDGEVTKDEDGYTVNLTENASNSNPDPLPDDVDLSNLTYERDLTAPGNEQGDDGSGDIGSFSYRMSEDIYPNDPNVRFRPVSFRATAFSEGWTLRQIGPFVLAVRR